MTDIAHSYSSLKAWRDCPRLHREKHVNKSVKDPGSASMQRGSRVHAQLENLVNRKPPGAMEVPLQDRIKRLVATLYRLRDKGAVLTERKLAVDREGKKIDFFDKKAWIRAVVDVLWLETPGKTRAFVVDWKTGAVRVDPLQADVTSYVLRRVYGVDQPRFAFAYVEHDKIVDATPASDPAKPVEELIAQVEADLAYDAEPRQCYMCRFCPVKWCEYNKNET